MVTTHLLLGYKKFFFLPINWRLLHLLSTHTLHNMSSPSESSEIASAQLIWYESSTSAHPCFTQALIEHIVTRLITNYTELSAYGMFSIAWSLSIVQLIQVVIGYSSVAFGLLIHSANGMAGNMVKTADWHSCHISPEQISIFGLYHQWNSGWFCTECNQVCTKCLASGSIHGSNSLFG